MKISVITACLNSSAYIGECLRSVAEQDYHDVEHLVIDGDSDDNTVSVVRELNHPGLKLVSESDNGIYYALNKGLEQCTGDLIGFLHSDDFFANKYILSHLAEQIKRSEADGIYGDLQYVMRNRPEQVVRHWESGIYQPKNLFKGWMPPHPALYLKREVYENFGRFDTDLSISADYDFILRVLYEKNTTLDYLPEIVLKMRTGGVSNRNLKNILQKSREDLIALKKNGVKNRHKVLLMKNLSKIHQFFKREETKEDIVKEYAID